MHPSHVSEVALVQAETGDLYITLTLENTTGQVLEIGLEPWVVQELIPRLEELLENL